MPNSRPSGLGMIFLVGGLPALALISLLCTVVPLVKCPECHGASSEHMASGSSVMFGVCKTCENKGALTIFEKWRTSRNAPAR
jgi:hypothetical protein